MTDARRRCWSWLTFLALWVAMMAPRDLIVSVIRELGPQPAHEVKRILLGRHEQAIRHALRGMVDAGELRILPGGKLELVK